MLPYPPSSPSIAIYKDGQLVHFIERHHIEGHHIVVCYSKKHYLCEKTMNKKDEVLTEIFKKCQQENNFVFHNDLVKDIARKVGFGNPFDATKIDNKDKLPEILLENDYAVIHLGNGNHQFIKGIAKVYHDFEPIQDTLQWNYKKSILNEYNSSESNILSVANNQRILHHFLFGKDTEFEDIDISKRPKTYFPHRTKTSL
jgi:hypothetical protein